MLNGYEVVIKHAVYHNGLFKFYNTRYETVHAHSREEAEKMVVLQGGNNVDIDENFSLRAEPEYVQMVRYLGRVVPRIVYDYVKE